MIQITIRKANPTIEDGLACARFIDMASEGGFRKALGKRHSDIIARAFVEPGHDLSYEHVLFAEIEGRIAGMASCFSVENHNQNTVPLRIAPGNRLRRSIGMAMMSLFFAMVSSHGEGEYYLEFLAVDDEFRGQGVGTALLNFTEEKAKEAGATKYTVDVSAKNEGAKRLYERFGCTIESAKPKTRLMPDFVYRMAKNIVPPQS